MADIKVTPTNLRGTPSTKISSDQLTIQQGRIVATPPSLQNVSHSLTLKGEVTQHNADGTVRIKTSRGSIDIKLDSPPSKGQKVDIQITSGHPPREVTIQTQARPAPSNQQHPTSHQSPSGETAHIKSQQPQTQTPQPVPAQNQHAQQSPPNTHISTPNHQTPSPQTDTNVINQAVKQLQATAKQAIETLGQVARTSNAQTSPTTDTVTQTRAPKPLATGQAIRLTPLPATMQNMTGLRQTALSVTGNHNTVHHQTLTPLSHGMPSSAPHASRGDIHVMRVSMPTSSLPILTSPALMTATSTGNTTHNIPTTMVTAIAPAQIPVQGQITSPLNNNVLSILNNSSLSTSSLQSPSSAAAIDGRVLNIQPLIISGQHNTTSQQAYTISAIINHANMSTQTANLSPSQIVAYATGMTTSQGNPIVQIIPHTTGHPPVFMALNYPATNVQKGTVLIMQPNPGTGTSNIIQPPQSWPALTESFEELMAQLQPAQAQSLLNILPRPASTGHQFTAAALLFIAAARGGDIAGWMGGRAEQILRAAEGGKKDIFNRLLSDLSNMTGRSPTAESTAPASTAGSPDWRGYTLPLLFGMDLSKINLWVTPFGDDNPPDTNDETMKGTRFIVDLELSRMGSVQLDGLIQPYAKRLDLALKSKHDFSSAMRQELRSLWHNALQSVDLSGHIDFQTY